MGDFNFFEWIRSGVRQSVLLGISDAVEQIGSPEGDELKKEVLTALDSKIQRNRTPRKRLGRSLKEIAPQ